MKRIAFLLSALFLLASCQGLRTKVFEDDLVMPREEIPADSLFYTVSVEYVTDGLPAPALEAVNRCLVQQAFDLEGVSASLEETAIRYRENLIDEFLSENGGTWEDKLSGAFAKPYKGWLNYTLSYYSFRGGAHGFQTVSQLVFDKKTGAQVAESDLFADGYVLPVSLLMREAVAADMLEQDAELLPLVEMENILPNGNFSLSPGGITWFFQPYEVGPYALGLVSACVGWNALKPYLK